MTATLTRYQAQKDRSGWYVEDTRTGRMWTGLTGIGARQLADHLNRATSTT